VASSIDSDLFINNCDEFIYYDDLVRKEPSKVAVLLLLHLRYRRPPGASRARKRGKDLKDALEQIFYTLEALTE